MPPSDPSKQRRTSVKSMTRKAVAAAAIGNAIEWFDFGVYGFLVMTVGEQFFPQTSPAAQTLDAFGVFALSFLIRPLGGIFFGSLGDRLGRKPILTITILLMALSTFAIGILPTFQQIGILAPVLLGLIRVVQGFSTGGEYAGAATFIAEYAPDRERGFLGSWLEFGTLAGFAGGAGLVTLFSLTLPHDAMAEWGWRIPFILALPLGLVGLYLRLRLHETPAFDECAAAHRGANNSPLREVLTDNRREALICIWLVVLLNTADYTVLVYLQGHLTQVLGISSESALLTLCAMLAGMMLLIVPLGSLSDRIGRKPLLLASGFGFLLFSWPAFWLLARNHPATTAAGLAIIGFFLVCYLAVVGSTLPAIFDTKVRYTGFAISYNLSTSLFGGSTPFMLAFLVRHTGSLHVPALYLMTAAALSITPMFLIRETANKPLRGTEAARRVAEQFQLSATDRRPGRRGLFST
jgi:MHS family proline/betaine transporter-like MFS transporter